LKRFHGLINMIGAGGHVAGKLIDFPGMPDHVSGPAT